MCQSQELGLPRQRVPRSRLEGEWGATGVARAELPIRLFHAGSPNAGEARLHSSFTLLQPVGKTLLGRAITAFGKVRGTLIRRLGRTLGILRDIQSAQFVHLFHQAMSQWTF